MTAIVTAYTKDGFVIGADGRVVDEQGRTTSDTQQKVFSFEWASIRLAYAWTGVMELAFQGGLKPLSRSQIREKTNKILSASANTCSDFASFIASFNAGLRTIFPSSIKNFPKDRSQLAKVILVGYFDGDPCAACSSTAYANDALEIREQHAIPVQCHKYVFTGSERVWTNYLDWQLSCDKDSIEFVSRYIHDCGQERDAKGIGGHTHIATIKPDGFSWVVPPV